MKALALAPILALAAFTFAAPPLAEAAHRHGRSCGHRGYGYSSDWGRRPIVSYRHYDRGWDYGRRGGYSSRYYGAYGYGYSSSVPYYDTGYYDGGYYDGGYYGYVPPPPPLPRIYRHRRHHRPHVGIFLGF